ncbi:MAG: ATP-binding protein [Chloroflexi bacterium]|nr:ATP-binding protein [Chloroflexota bacterium]
MPTVQFTIPVDHKYLSVLGTTLTTFMEQVGDEMLAYTVQLAIHEVCTNVIDHAYGAPAPEQNIQVTLFWDEHSQQLVAEITDQGRPFDPLQHEWSLPMVWQAVTTANGPAYRLESVAEPGLEQERGRGIFMIRQLMDEVLYLPHNGHNVWRLTRQLGRAG